MMSTSCLKFIKQHRKKDGGMLSSGGHGLPAELRALSGTLGNKPICSNPLGILGGALAHDALM